MHVLFFNAKMNPTPPTVHSLTNSTFTNPCLDTNFAFVHPPTGKTVGHITIINGWRGIHCCIIRVFFWKNYKDNPITRFITFHEIRFSWIVRVLTFAIISPGILTLPSKMPNFLHKCLFLPLRYLHLPRGQAVIHHNGIASKGTTDV